MQEVAVALNPQSQPVVFSKFPQHRREIDELKPTLRLFGENISIVAEATYLGVIFDTGLTWEPQFRQMTTKAYKRLNLLRTLSSLSANPNPNTMIHLYRSILTTLCHFHLPYRTVCECGNEKQRQETCANLKLRKKTFVISLEVLCLLEKILKLFFRLLGSIELFDGRFFKFQVYYIYSISAKVKTFPIHARLHS